ncbi:MAG: polyprenol monophosphomannose synthase [Magnetococcales bacterium]|nr:polyprenol monophosphomannose synthase [Magnetococcales bacterium]
MPELAIVIPTYNESKNIKPLVARLDQTLDGIDWQVLFVDDDSPDNTADVVTELGRSHARVACLKRVGEKGLSSACIAGMRHVCAPVYAIMDADLQHDETRLPLMLEQIRVGADLCIGTRYSSGGSVGEWGMVRQVISRSATWMTNFLLGTRLSDPMSGFFMVTDNVMHHVFKDLEGQGFKILLDIVVHARQDIVIREVPFTFRPRVAGESKLRLSVIVALLVFLGKKAPRRFMQRIFPVHP